MQLTPTITFRGIERTAALEAEVMTRLHKLETYYHRIMGCRVIVELVQRHHEAGNRYHVGIDLTVPGEEIVVTHEAGRHATSGRVGERPPRRVTAAEDRRLEPATIHPSPPTTVSAKWCLASCARPIRRSERSAFPRSG